MTVGFAALGVRRDLVTVIEKQGLRTPTPVQAKAIPALLKGRDVIAQAQTGTGKTLAFLLPILERVDGSDPAVQALILCPTRELALQITTEAKKLAPVVGASVLATYGGQDVAKQIHRLQGAAQIVVATPGRLLDHLRRGTIQLNRLTTLVLDEADQMLHMGFLPEVEQVIGRAPRERTTILCSATMPPAIRALARRYMRDPAEIQIEGKQVTLEEIEQVVVETTDRTKQDALCQKLDEYNPYLAVIFCRTKIRADKLYDALTTRGYNADVLHGDLSQAKREQVMRRFREAQTQFLVATDVAARGLDVEGVTHVFNYDIPQDVESYIHRIGRTGRAGQKGVAVTFVAPRDQALLRQIEQGLQGALARQNAPGQSPARPAAEPREGRPPRRRAQSGPRAAQEKGTARPGTSGARRQTGKSAARPGKRGPGSGAAPRRPRGRG